MLCVIPARGGSKGIPRKNIVQVADKPLIAHTIELALKFNKFSKVFVSTDDLEIAEISKNFGADVSFMRNEEISGDKAQAIDAYIHAIDGFAELGEVYKEITVLLPTSPLRSLFDLEKSYELFKSKNADSVISYTEAHHPVSWYREIQESGTVVSPQFLQGEFVYNRQEEPQYFIPNGSIYIFKSDLLKKKKSYFSDKTFGYIMPQDRSLDVDTPFDLQLLDLYMSANKGEG